MTSLKDIWDTLSAIDCAGKTKKKQNQTYLSWAFAWEVLMKHYPDSSFQYLEPTIYPDGSMEIVCQVTIAGHVRQMTLPVMDMRNKAIPNPDAMAINKAKQRCLVKTIALFGLGLYIYAGEDFPGETDPKPIEMISQEGIARIKELLELCADGTEERMLKAMGVAKVEEMPQSATAGCIKRLEAMATS